MCKPVTCATCGRTIARKDAVTAELMEPIDGDTTNLDPSNIRPVGVEYQCHLCVQLECLEYSPIVQHHERFQQGYKIGVEEARKGWYNLKTECLSDVELVSCFKGLFAEFAAEGSEEVLYYNIGTTVGLLIGMATMPAIDAYAVTRIDGTQASS